MLEKTPTISPKKGDCREDTPLCDRQPFSLLGIQQFLLAESKRCENPGMNLEQVVAELDESLDEDMMRAAWKHAIESHEVLRAAFNCDPPDRPTQQVEPNPAPPVITVEAEGHSALEDLLAEERERGFDLNQAPLMRVVLLRYSAGRWAMVWTVHHLLVDRDSISIVLKQVFEVYEALVAGRPLATLKRTSPKILLHREEQIDHAEGLKAIQQMFDQRKSATTLPLYPNGGGQPSQKNAEVRQEFPDQLDKRLRQCAREAEVTQKSVVQLAWGILLHRHGAGRDVSWGNAWSTRLDGALSDVVAPSTVLLPVRVELESDRKVRCLLQSLHADQLTLQRYRWTPLQAIERVLGGEQKLFETLVIYEHSSFEIELPKLEGWADRRFWSHSESSYPLTLMAQEDNAALSFGLRYDTGLYDKQTAAQLLDDYLHILAAVTKQLDQPLRKLNVLSPAARNQWVDQQCTREQTDTEDCVLKMVMDQCQSQPDALAIHALEHGSAVSYGELGLRIRRLARTLRAEGVRAGDIVAIHVSRSIEAIVSMLAIHEVGAAFLPLDINSPADRRIYMLEDSQVRLMLVDESCALDTPVKQLLVHQRFEEVDLDASPKASQPPTPMDSLAYVIYTSGSTGKPKGVCVEHKSFANHIMQMAKVFGLSSEDRILQFASLAFDASLEEVFTALVAGGSLWLRDDKMPGSARSFFDRVTEHKLSVITLTTSFWHQMVHSQIAWPPCVRLVVVGGERVDPRIHGQFRQLVDDRTRFINIYGPTETTIASTCYDDAEEDHDLNVLPIGRPFAGVSCFVLDENLVPVPPQVEGQLYIGGVGLARGYLGRDKLTAERFIDHPFRANARLYATGDLVRRTPKGNLVFVDRIDHQVKVQGYRVELGEIENRLRSYQGIEDAVVLALSLPGGGGPRLVAYVQAPEASVDANRLRDFVGEALPAYMVPRQVEVMRAFAHTPAGKVDRQALKKRANAPQKDEPIPGVGDPLQTQLLHIWSETLKVPVTDPSADFFALGGDSLLAVRLFTEIERELGLQCKPQEFFKTPTVEALAEIISHHDGTDSKSPLVKLAEGPATVRPIFLAPTVSGEVTDYFHLAEALGNIAPIYGLQMRGLRSGDEIHNDLPDAAHFYVQLMRSVQPKGPYSIIGFSAGGTVGLAIAEVLHEQGERTDLLAMLDAVPPNIESASPFTSPVRIWRFGCTFLDRIRELLEGRNAIGNLIKRAGPSLKHLWAQLWPWAPKPQVEVEALFERSGISELTPEEVSRMQAHLDSVIEFRSQGYPIDIVLIRSKHDPLEGPYEDGLGWDQAVSGNIQVQTVPVRHYDMLVKSTLGPVAAKLTDYVNARDNGRED
jgi:amino acid adenylation domain-containing protein